MRWLAVLMVFAAACSGDTMMLGGAPLKIVTETLPEGIVGQEYSAMIASDGGAGLTRSWKIFAGAPPGVSITATNDLGAMTLAGVPELPGRFVLTVGVTDEDGFLATRIYEVLIASRLEIVLPEFAPAYYDEAYSAMISVNGGT